MPKKYDPVIVDVLSNFESNQFSGDDFTYENVTMSSPDKILVEYSKDSYRLMEIVDFVNNKSWNSKRCGSHSVLSPDGKLIICDCGSLKVINKEDGLVIGGHAYPPDCVIHLIKWIFDDIYMIVSSYGILRFQLSEMSNLTLMAAYDEIVNYRKIIDIQVDVENNWYILICDDNKYGLVQFGNFSVDKWRVLVGQAACLCRSNDCYGEKVLFSMLMKDDEEDSYTMKVQCLSDDMIIESKRIDFSSFSGDRPICMIPECNGSIAYVSTETGKLFVWDMLTSILIETCSLTGPILLSRPLSTGGFIAVIKKQKYVFSTKVNREELVEEYSSHEGNENYALHLAIRMGLHDTYDPDLRSLMSSLLNDSLSMGRDALLAILDKISVKDMSKAVEQCGQGSSILCIISFLFNTWLRKEGIEWLKEIEWWFNNTSLNNETNDISPVKCCKLRPDTILSPTVDSDSVPMSDTEQYSTMIVSMMRILHLEDDVSLDTILISIDDDEVRRQTRECIKKMLNMSSRSQEPKILPEPTAPPAFVSGVPSMSSSNSGSLLDDVGELAREFVSDGITSVDNPHIVQTLKTRYHDVFQRSKVRILVKEALLKELNTKPTDELTEMAEMFMKNGIDTRSEAGKEILKEKYPDVFTRAKITIALRKRLDELKEKTETKESVYDSLARKMKEEGLNVDDEAGELVLDELFPDIDSRRIAKDEIRKRM